MMKRLKLRSVLTGLVIASITLLSPIGASAEWKRGSVPSTNGNRPAYWYKEGDSWATGWKQVDGDWYYFEPSTGYADAGWTYLNGNWYFFDGGGKGIMYHDTITLNNCPGQGYYYLNSNGICVNNPSEEIKAYINLLEDSERMKELGILSRKEAVVPGLFEGSTMLQRDTLASDTLCDTDGDGILEMKITTKFIISTGKFTTREVCVKYTNGNIIVDNGNITSTDRAATATKNFIYESGLQFNASNGKIVAYTGTDTSFSIPSSINGVNVTSIGLQSFGGNNTLTSITIPTGITSIEKRAFGMCPNLKNITIPSSVTSIGKDAFLGSDNLTFIVENEQTKNLLINSGVSANQVKIK